MKRIYVVGTADTKGQELAFLLARVTLTLIHVRGGG